MTLESYTLRCLILCHLTFISILVRGKSKEIIYYIQSGVTLPEGKQMDPICVFSYVSLHLNVLYVALLEVEYLSPWVLIQIVRDPRTALGQWMVFEGERTGLSQKLLSSQSVLPLEVAQGCTCVSLKLVLVPGIEGRGTSLGHGLYQFHAWPSQKSCYVPKWGVMVKGERWLWATLSQGALGQVHFQGWFWCPR